MKILTLCYEYPPLGGGGGVGVQQYAEAWVRKGHDVIVVTSWAKRLRFAENINGVDIIRIWTIGKKDRATTTFVSMFSYVVFGFLYFLFHKRKFLDRQIINSHFSLPTGLLGLLTSKMLHISHVLTIIGGDIYDPSKKNSPHRSYIMRSLNKFIMDNVEQIVAISSDTRSRAIELYDTRRSIKIINYGFTPIEHCEINNLNFRDDPKQFNLISVGRLVERKGFKYLIMSMKQLPCNIILNIIGDGPLESALKKLTRDNHLDKRVKFLGYKPRQEVYEYMQHSDCFVLPSLHEGLGLVVQEAMSAGLPIVSTDNGGQLDLIHDGRNGILVKPGSIEMLNPQ